MRKVACARARAVFVQESAARKRRAGRDPGIASLAAPNFSIQHGRKLIGYDCVHREGLHARPQSRTAIRGRRAMG